MQFFFFFLVNKSLGKGRLPHTRARASRSNQRGLKLDLQITHQGGLLAVGLEHRKNLHWTYRSLTNNARLFCISLFEFYGK